MFFGKKDPTKKLKAEYQKLLGEAMELQRNGKIPEFAKKSAEANAVYEELQKLENEAS